MNNSIIRIVLLLAFSCLVKASDKAVNNAPNIIMIVADDLGFDDVSFRGSDEFLTPNIDALAYHGRILDRLYASPSCTSSRSSLLTGKFPVNIDVCRHDLNNGENWALPLKLTTFPEVLRGAGYNTQLIGKWHLGMASKNFTPTYRGFDNHFGFWGAYIDYYDRTAKMPYPYVMYGYDFRRDMQLSCEKPGTYITDLFADEAESIILNNNGSKPLFLLLNHLAPHASNDDNNLLAALQAPEEDIRKFRYIQNTRRRRYAAMVHKLDQSVGRVVRALESANMLENSIIIFFSDNGAKSIGNRENSGSNWPFRGQKQTVWEGAVRVGGAFWSSLANAKGNVFRQAMHVSDWFPTLAHAAGVKLHNALHIDGLDLWSQLISETEQIVSRDFPHGVWLNRAVSIMHDTWKYINGTTDNGNYDTVLTYRELDELDPRANYYVNEVRSSLTSKALKKYDIRRLSKSRIERLRREAGVHCDNDFQRSCNPLIEECLFNIQRDPCELNNLAYLSQYKDVLIEMRQRAQNYQKHVFSMPSHHVNADYDPQLYNCKLSNFMEERISERRVCSTENALNLNCAATDNNIA